MAHPVRSVDEIVADLALLGVCEGDTLMVHASLRRIGPVEGGAAGVIAALDAAVGPRGTWLAVLGARDDTDWVNDEPEAQREALLREQAVPFDPLVTPAVADVGVLPEVMRTTPGTVVDTHPEGRLAARGPDAARLMANVPLNDYYGPGSVLARVLERNVRILRLGADPDTVTLIHHAEYLADVADKLRVRRYRLIAAEPEPEVVVVECLDDEDGIVAIEGEDYFTTILREYFATGAARHGIVGRASSDLIEGADLVAFAARWMERVLGGH